MEKLTQDLFKDPALETNAKSVAGTVIYPDVRCYTALGGSTCITGGGADVLADPTT